MIEQHYTVQQAAVLLGVDEEQILATVNSGELVAVNVTKTVNAKRPRWRIAESELGRFLLRRRHPASQPQPTRTAKSKEPKQYV